MKRFWLYYDNLSATRPVLRFSIFLVLAAIFLAGVPLAAHWIADIPMDIAHAIGAVLMAALAWDRHLRTENKSKFRKPMIVMTGICIVSLTAVFGF